MPFCRASSWKNPCGQPSASAVQTFAACPYKHLLDRGFRLAHPGLPLGPLLEQRSLAPLDRRALLVEVRGEGGVVELEHHVVLVDHGAVARDPLGIETQGVQFRFPAIETTTRAEIAASAI